MPAAATVDIATHNVKVNGFAEGQPNVDKAGHVAGMSVFTLKNHYFTVSPDNIVKGGGDVTITPIDGFGDKVQLRCDKGTGEGTTPYGSPETAG